ARRASRRWLGVVLAPWRVSGRVLRMTVPADDPVHIRLYLHARCAVAGDVDGSARRHGQEPGDAAGVGHVVGAFGAEMMETYLLVKWIHVLSSTLLFGTGLGIAFFMWMAHLRGDAAHIAATARTVVIADRSEEHTSELQSRENLVCRLLLEKKNKSSSEGSKTLRSNATLWT